VRLWGTRIRVATHDSLEGIHNYVKVFSHATRSRVYPNLLKALYSHRDVRTAKVIKEDGGFVAYTPQLLSYIASKLTDGEGNFYSVGWDRNPEILVNTICATLNQMYLRDLRLRLAVPTSTSVTPPFPSTGLYSHSPGAMAPIVSLHNRVL